MQALWGFRTCRRWLWSSGGAFRCFCPLCRFALGALACKYGSISRFKGVFSAVWGFRVGLCCLGGLRGLCGFCARVELGGLKTCCVFAFVFLLLSLCLLSFYALCLLWLSSCLVFAALSLWVFVFSFSLSDYTQKERAQRFCSLRPLFVCCVCSDSCTVVEKLLRCVFGFFQFVRFVLPTNTTGVRRFARSYFDFLRHNVDITNNRPAFLK